MKLNFIAGLAAIMSPFISTVLGLTQEQFNTALYNEINYQRNTRGLPTIPYSAELTKVSNFHTGDLLRNRGSKAAGGCNLHSWYSPTSSVAGCCYTENHSNPSCMWDKPSQLTNYDDTGFEIAYNAGENPKSLDEAEARRIIQVFLNSPPHRQVILSEGKWASNPWLALGAANQGSFTVAWFGKTRDGSGATPNPQPSSSSQATTSSPPATTSQTSAAPSLPPSPSSATPSAPVPPVIPSAPAPSVIPSAPAPSVTPSAPAPPVTSSAPAPPDTPSAPAPTTTPIQVPPPSSSSGAPSASPPSESTPSPIPPIAPSPAPSPTSGEELIPSDRSLPPTVPTDEQYQRPSSPVATPTPVPGTTPPPSDKPKKCHKSVI